MYWKKITEIPSLLMIAMVQNLFTEIGQFISLFPNQSKGSMSSTLVEVSFLSHLFCGKIYGME